MKRRRFDERRAERRASGADLTARGSADEPHRHREYGIDELARAAGTTVRNVRAYQDRGLLPPPERRGRVGVFGEPHLSRLRIVGQLLGRGYTLASIAELITAWERGSDLAGLLGLESAAASPWGSGSPAYLDLAELVTMFGGSFDPRWIARAAELGLLEIDGGRFRTFSPRLLQAGADLARLGIPLDDLFEMLGSLRANVEQAADLMVRLIEKHLFARFGAGLPPAPEAAALGAVIWQLRPLVEAAVNAEIARAMERASRAHLGDRLAHVLERFEADRGPDPDATGDADAAGN